MSVSIIIPTYNSGRYLRESVSSALEQTVRADEIIIVDDGSTDDTSKIVEGFGQPNVFYVYQENGGVSAARNRGIAESSGQLIAFLDADDIWEATKLEKQIAKFVQDPEIGLVHCGLRQFDSATGETIATHLDGGEGWVAEKLALWESPVILGPGGSIMVRRAVFDEVGGFDVRLKNGEDWEFCIRVAMKYRVGFVPEVLVHYRDHGLNATKNVAEMERSTLLAWEKVFSTDDDRIQKLRRRSYGNLHKVLAGSYLHAGMRSGFLRNLAKSLWYRPSYLSYYLKLASGRK